MCDLVNYTFIVPIFMVFMKSRDSTSVFLGVRKFLFDSI